MNSLIICEMEDKIFLEKEIAEIQSNFINKKIKKEKFDINIHFNYYNTQELSSVNLDMFNNIFFIENNFSIRRDNYKELKLILKSKNVKYIDFLSKNNTCLLLTEILSDILLKHTYFIINDDLKIFKKTISDYEKEKLKLSVFNFKSLEYYSNTVYEHYLDLILEKKLNEDYIREGFLYKLISYNKDYKLFDTKENCDKILEKIVDLKLKCLKNDIDKLEKEKHKLINIQKNIKKRE